jgi:hypothetical protein
MSLPKSPKIRHEHCGSYYYYFLKMLIIFNILNCRLTTLASDII